MNRTGPAAGAYPVVIPAAGRGSRLGRLTRFGSKELLPLGDDVVLSYILEELRAAGVEEVVIVSRPDKPDIRAYVDWIRREHRFDLDVRIVHQSDVPGNGGAILSAAAVIGQRPFMVVWGDEVFVGGSRLGQLIAGYEETGAPCISLRAVSEADVPKCGIAEVVADDHGRLRVSRLLEKPAASVTASRWASVGGYVLDPRLVDLLARVGPSADGEVYLSSALDRAAAEGPLYGVAIDAEWFETGSYEGYARAFTEVARSRGLA